MDMEKIGFGIMLGAILLAIICGYFIVANLILSDEVVLKYSYWRWTQAGLPIIALVVGFVYFRVKKFLRAKDGLVLERRRFPWEK